MPIIFGFLKMNKNIEEFNINNNESIIGFEDTKKKKRNIFTTTLFVNYYEKSRYPFLHMKLENVEKKKN